MPTMPSGFPDLLLVGGTVKGHLGIIPGSIAASANGTETLAIGAPTLNTADIMVLTDDPSNPRSVNTALLMAVQDHNNAPIFAIPPAGGPKAFGDYMGCWTGTATASVTFTPWDGIQFVGAGVSSFTGPTIYAASGAPLPASTVTKLGTFSQVANVGDMYIRSDTQQLYWCTVAGNGGARGGTWTPNYNVAGNINANFGNFDASLAGTGFRAAEGANAKQGLTGAMVAGSVTVSNTSVTANSRIIACRAPGGTNPGAWWVSAQTAGTSFVCSSTNAADTGTGSFQIFEPG